MAQQLVGIVIGTRAMKTAKVEVTRMVLHPHVIKYIKRQRKYLCHDPDERCRVGDLVMIKQHPNISKRKHFEVVNILEKSPAHLAEEQQQQQQNIGSDTPTSSTSGSSGSSAGSNSS